MITRDQERARHAYECVGGLPGDKRKDYRSLVRGLGLQVRRSGLMAALTLLQNDKEKNRREAGLLLDHLASAEIPELSGEGSDLPGLVRNMEVESYMLATREALRVLLWLGRAADACQDE